MTVSRHINLKLQVSFYNRKHEVFRLIKNEAIEDKIEVSYN